MAVFTPGRRWQAPFLPSKKEPFGKRVLRKVERMVKGPLFGCRMCGNCLLQETAFICPMECPKGMRNGPCGGSTPEKCYVDETRPCIWYKIYERSFKMGREKRLLEVLPPLDWDKAGTETWGDVIRSIRHFGSGSFIKAGLSRNKEKKRESWEAVFQAVRQPSWWKGDPEYHPPLKKEPVSPLESALKAGKFVITAEVSPPLSAATGKLKRDIALVGDLVTAINFTDSASAYPRMSSMACCKIAADMGADPVLQIAARDKTRSGLQSDIMGANVMGVHNVLCISGDHARTGPTPTSSTNILDMDAVQMLWILRRMRDEGIYLDGRKMNSAPRLFLGAAASPFASEPRFQALREEKKINAGAQFFQTNLIFDAQALDPWLEALDKRGVPDKVFILAGVTPIRSRRMALHLHHHIPGVRIPKNILDRFEEAKEDNYEELGVEIALDIMEKIRGKQGIRGFHLMSVGWEAIVPRLIRDAGLQSSLRAV
ncbi:MAG: methylenetetrahydrofolate reductase C-terminal domain-containing protein [Bacteroidales bacterium]|nr:methylenetetrahydrofolate reductase C-terminal domain-containing protein [Bacteroidales bacterium]